MSNQQLASGVRAATNNLGDNVKVPGAKGVKVMVNFSAVPGVDTVTVTIQGKDRVSGNYFTILASAAIVATGQIVLTVYPGIAAAGNIAANDALPDIYRVLFTHSAGTNFTYSAAVDELF